MRSIATMTLLKFAALALSVSTVAASAATSNDSSTRPCTSVATVNDCLRQLKRTMADTSRFWFGDEWRFNCAHDGSATGGLSKHRTGTFLRSSRCLNPRDLQDFHSIGTRLFRVHTFSDALLDDLRFVPTVTFVTHSGGYRACDHDFSVGDGSDGVERMVGFNRPPIVAFQARQTPTVDWSDRDDGSYTVLIVDVGAGALKFLAVDFPHAPRILHVYEELDNFRPGQPTPMAVVVFEQQAGCEITVADGANAGAEESTDAPFDLGQFMLDNELDGSLVGLNWFLVEADAYSIERHRLRGTVDNCHVLIQQKLIEERRWPFVEFFSLGEMDASLTVRAIRPETKLGVCCTFRSVDEETVFADPLGNEDIPSSALRLPPTVTSLRSLAAATGDNYQRAQRHYIVLKEERYTLVAFEPTRRHLFWLVVDIPAEALPLGDAIVHDGHLVAPYVSPVPDRSGACDYAVFVLLRQPAGVSMIDFYNNDHTLRSRFCVRHCHNRENFAIEQFKSFHRLRLSALNWVRVCYDAYEADRQIRQIYTSLAVLNAEGNVSSDGAYNHRARKPSVDGVDAWSYYDVERSKTRLRDKVRNICANVFGESFVVDCQTGGAPAAITSLATIILIIIFTSIFRRLFQAL